LYFFANLLYMINFELFKYHSMVKLVALLCQCGPWKWHIGSTWLFYFGNKDVQLSVMWNICRDFTLGLSRQCRTFIRGLKIKVQVLNIFHLRTEPPLTGTKKLQLRWIYFYARSQIYITAQSEHTCIYYLYSSLVVNIYTKSSISSF
jgi:hypothetical protein